MSICSSTPLLAKSCSLHGYTLPLLTVFPKLWYGLSKTFVMMLTCHVNSDSFLASKVNQCLNACQHLSFPQRFAAMAQRWRAWRTFVEKTRECPLREILRSASFVGRGPSGKPANGAENDRSRPPLEGCSGNASDWFAIKCKSVARRS